MQKNIKKSTLFTVIFAGLSEITHALFQFLELENSIKIFNLTGFIGLFLVLVSIVTFISLNLINEKVNFNKMAFIVGSYIIIIGLLAFNLFKSIDVSQIMSII